jgi:ABC-2 type transport system permease protein
MRKILTVASSEFQTAVRSKAFVVGIAIMPVLILASIGVQKVAGDRIDRDERRVAVVDHTERLYPLLEQAALAWNARQVAKDGAITGPRYVVERATVGSGGSIEALRLDLSARVQAKALFAFVELPTGLLQNEPTIRYHTNNPTYEALPRWLEQVIGRLVIVERLRTTNVDPQTLIGLMQRIQVSTLGLLERDASGRVLEGERVDAVRNFVTPMVMMVLMFTIVISTASPLLNSVMEEKMTRISEVLLGSVTPFQLMMGKLLGVIGVSLVLAVIYLSGAYGIARYHGYADAVGVAQIAWFIVYLVLAMFIYGSLFIAIGAASTDLKDAQGLMTPVMVLFMAPMFVWMPVLRAPESSLSVIASLVPFATPVLMTLRMALKPSPALWQIGLSFLLTGVTTVILVWAAGRIFRVGILMQGKSATFGEMFKWVKVG